MNNKSVSYREEHTDVFLISGFLGAGKTTLLKHILSWKRDMSDTIVIVNEFGDIGIDASLLKGQTSDVIELTSGCICCTLTVDLTILMENLWMRFSPRWIMIEASGIADPASIISVFQKDHIKERIEALKVITVLDADCWAARSIMGRIFFSQIETADVILLNKIDRLEKNTVKNYLKELRRDLPMAQVIPTIHCRVDPESLLFDVNKGSQSFKDIQPDEGILSGTDINQKLQKNNGTQNNRSTSDEEYVTFSFEDTRPMYEISFRKFVSELPPEVFRLKGTVRFEDRTMMINFVGGRAEWKVWDNEAATRLSFIGWETKKELILSRLEECIV